jgi:hypothetical protein
MVPMVVDCRLLSGWKRVTGWLVEGETETKFRLLRQKERNEWQTEDGEETEGS